MGENGCLSSWIKSDAAERVKKPSYYQVAKWCLQAWDELPTSLIIDSFIYCNLGVERNDEYLHEKLHDILDADESSELEEIVIEEPTGLTDDEEPNERELTTIIEETDSDE